MPARCDLCGNSPNPPCIGACRRGALSFERDFLGWRALPPQAGEYECANWGGFCFSQAEARLVDAVLSRFRESAHAAGNPSQAHGALEAILRQICAETGFALEKPRAHAVLKAAEMNSSGFGPLDLLLHDADLEEISVVGSGRRIYVFHKTRGWLKANCAFTTDASAINAINRMARPLGRRVTFQSPRLNASLAEGGVRVHAAIPPLSQDVEITLRKFSKTPLSVPDLVSFGTISAEAAAFLWLALQADVSLIVAGNTGSGKTSTLNALLSFVPLSERVVVVEETPELRPLHRHCVRLVASEDAGIPMRDLVKDTLRMRPDRVVVGEVRSKPEAEALFDSVLAGQAKGTYATMHAKSAKDCLARLASFGLPTADLGAFDLIVVQRRIPVYDAKEKTQKELRRVTEIAEVRGGEADLIFRHNARNGKLEGCGRSLLLERLCANYQTNRAGMEKEVQKRAEFMEKRGRRRMGFEEFAQSVGEYLFGEK